MPAILHDDVENYDSPAVGVPIAETYLKFHLDIASQMNWKIYNK